MRFLLAALALAGTIHAAHAQAVSAEDVLAGVQSRCPAGAVCRSLKLEREAKALVLARCKRERQRCDPGEVGDWVYSLQMNRGPYASKKRLADDVFDQVGRRR